MEIGKKYGCLTILGKLTNLITNANVNAVKYIISMKNYLIKSKILFIPYVHFIENDI